MDKESAIGFFNALCLRYGCEPSDYSSNFGRSYESCIAAICQNTFAEEFWFTRLPIRYSIHTAKFREFLVSRGVCYQTYESVFNRSIACAIRILDQGLELDEDYWLSKGDWPTKEEAAKVFDDLLAEKGLSIDEYESKYRRFRSTIICEIASGVPDEDDCFFDRIFTRRISDNSELKFFELCAKYDVHPSSYSIKFSRSKFDCIDAIEDGSFEEEKWFSSATREFALCRDVFLDLLKEEGVDISSYEETYRRRIHDAQVEIFEGRFTCIKDWLKTGELPTFEESHAIFINKLKSRNIEIAEYENYFARSIQRSVAEIWQGFAYRDPSYFDRVIFRKSPGGPEEVFRNKCYKYGLDHGLRNTGQYGRIFGKRRDDCIANILKPGFCDEDWFTPWSYSIKKSLSYFEGILEKSGIDPEIYEERFGHNKYEIAKSIHLLDEIREDSLKYVLMPCVSNKQRKDIANQMLLDNGIDPSEYTVKFKRLKSNISHYIRKRGIGARINTWHNRFLHPDTRKSRSDSYILDTAKSLFVSPGRKAGLQMAELSDSFLQDCLPFYPGGLSGLNNDLLLEPAAEVPESQELDPANLLKTEDSKSFKKLNQLSGQINAITEFLAPGKLAALQAELEQLRSQVLTDQVDEFMQDDLASELSNNNDNSSVGLNERLWANIQSAARQNPGYLYFKQWRLPETTWFKIGITNSLKRRDKEQNILPVPSELVAVVEFDSMHQAGLLEKAFHSSLEHVRLKGAKNKELFHLSSGDFAVIARAFIDLGKVNPFNPIQ